MVPHWLPGRTAAIVPMCLLQPDGPMTTPRVPVRSLVDFAASAFAAAGVAESDARRAAELLIESDLNGSDGHGIFRLAQYIGGLTSGRIAARGTIAVDIDGPATAHIDGGNALGHLVMARATDIAIEKARTQGAAWVGVRGSNHAGAASVWAARMLPHDMIGIYMAVGSNNFMAPWGGFERLLGTNPIAFAVPGLEEPPILFDMATSIAANGKIQVARQRGEPLPEGWVIDREGRPITDPAAADEGLLLPIGEYKGYGLSLMIGLIGATLNGGQFGREPTDPKASNTGQAVLALSIERFGDVTAFKRQVDAIARDIRGSGRLPGVSEIRVPGDRAWKVRQEREAQGIPVPPGLRAALDKLADGLCIPRLD
jgi:L-2-hydroxycarboxylate dehydrogenase (NAD+)